MKNRPLMGVTFLILIAIVMFAIAPLTLFNMKSFKQFFYLESEIYLYNSCLMIKNLLPEALDINNISTLQSITDKAVESTDLRITITNRDGQVLADSHNDPDSMNNHADRPEIIAALKELYGTDVRESATMVVDMMYTAVKLDFADGNEGTLRISRPLADVDKSVQDITRSSLLICAVLLVIVGWISFLLAGNVSSILQRISSTARKYASGNFNDKLRISRPPEISAIADDLNLMGRQLKDRIETIESGKNELQLILNNMSEAVLFTDKNLHILRVNGAAEILFNITNSQQQGKSILEIFMNSQLNDFAVNLLTEGKHKVEELTLNRPKLVHLKVSGTALYDTTGENISSLLLVMHDITQAKQLEQMRKDFVANVSHELKTPVTLIKGYIETLLDSPAGVSEQTKGFLEIMEKHSIRIEAIIIDLLTLSGIEKGGDANLSIEETPAVDLITSAAASCRNGAGEKDIEIQIDCNENLIMNVYPLMAEQAVINLIDNAVKYSDGGTEITVKVKEGPEGKICISVKDQGCGISTENQARIFERFYRVDKARSRDSGGTGLGLSIVKHIALSHGGTINVKSRPGKGAEFTLCL
ncbi:MAG TPA: hypothetical protein DCO79_04865 [Spirochaeta sp.]|nr:hypothetical protein [Spirochaeta sp.]